MNTLGKVFVFLNLVAAMLVAGFITYNFAARTNNYQTNEQFKTELEVTRKSNLALQETYASLQSQVTALKAENETLRQDKALLQSQTAILEADLLKRAKDAEARSRAADDKFDIALAAQQRMAKEVEDLKRTIEDREGRVLALHVKLRDSEDLSLARDRDLKFSQERNEILNKRVQELEKYIADLVSTARADGSGALPKDPTAPNPPQKFIKGVVERVDATDKTLVRVSLGTDHGLKVNNTLEVYRLSPSAEYIGLIRIEDAHHHTSVGRLVRSPGTGPRAVKEGDVVSSSLNPR